MSAIKGEFTGGVYAHLDRASRKITGVFFSGDDWARILIKKIPSGRWSRFVDPSAGTGDLLIAVAARFRKKKSLALTLQNLARRLVAVDLEPEFIRLVWLRLASLALVKHGFFRRPDMGIFSVPDTFKAGDFLSLELPLKRGDCVITNPPYQRIKGGAGRNGAGLRSAAALHLEKITESCPDGVGMVALVPDVLRCGRNYRKFRDHLHDRIADLEIESHGQFSCGVDVDVAIISGVTCARAAATREGACGNDSVVRIADHFKVSVGAVVPHRDSEDGELRPYVTARSLQKWDVLKEVLQWATYKSKSVVGPFVVIRRTSSPSDRKRAVATVIDVKCPVLVENHLIVVHPLSGGVKECEELMKSLEDPRTDEWLNKRMRCRHLTVGAIKEMPFHRSGR
ncbi:MULTISPECIES: TRM11 family methyltransferase [unclassified Xanthomonas]|uniref:hypothetical protein n=1 Tax=Xanthomonas sp. LMG 9002 TaxID=1591158 RepID=UPI00136ED002|nr:hypothetical protein [Xanthomonas sp. LMG 9002]